MDILWNFLVHTYSIKIVKPLANMEAIIDLDISEDSNSDRINKNCKSNIFDSNAISHLIATHILMLLRSRTKRNIRVYFYYDFYSLSHVSHAANAKKKMVS